MKNYNKFDLLMEQYLFGEISFSDLNLLMKTILNDRQKFEYFYRLASILKGVQDEERANILHVSAN